MTARSSGAALFLAFSCCAAAEPLQRFAYEKAEMGLPFRVVLYAADAASAKTAADAAFERIAQLNSVFSDYDPDSEVSRLCRTSGSGRAVPVSRDLWTVLQRAQTLAQQTDGAFDVTIGPLVNLWRRVRRKRELPSPELIAEFKARTGWQHVKMNEAAQTVELLKPEMRLDFGGIAKGYAIDAALAVLRERGISRALISGSGDMAAGDPPPGLTGWRIEAAALDVPGAPAAEVVLLKNNAIATSGDLFQHVEINGVRYSHIVDPATGLGLTDRSLVTIVAADCTTADSLATAASVLGPARALPLIESTAGAAARIARKPGEQVEFITSTEWAIVTKSHSQQP